MDSANVSLLPNSLYVATNLLMNLPGRFHWALVVTDANTVGTQYQWEELLPRTNRADPLEGFTCRYPFYATTYAGPQGLTCMLAYVRVCGFRAEAGAHFDYEATLGGIFTHSYADVRSNRRAGMSCRTWLIKALAIMEEAGVIDRAGLRPLGDVEGVVIERSVEAEKTVGNGTFVGSFVGEI